MDLKDPATFRALAHPLRLELFERLAIEGAATASRLADLVDETPANCSFHLRVLAKHGYIERAEGADGRQRPWRVRDVTQHWGGDLSAESEVAKDSFLDALEQWDRRRNRVAKRLPSPDGWHDTQLDTRSTLLLTADEARELATAIQELIAQHVDRWQTGERVEGGRPVRFIAQSYLVPGHDEQSAPTEPREHSDDEAQR